MALLGGSPARDAGDMATCPTTDQRGVHRPQGVGCDIGAYEVPHPAVFKPSASVVHQAQFTVAWRIPGGGPGAAFFDVRYRDRPAGGGPFGLFHSLLDHTTARHTSFIAPQFGFAVLLLGPGGRRGRDHVTVRPGTLREGPALTR